MTKQTNKPVHKISAGNGITASIWKNDGKHGSVYSITVERRYRNSEDEWHSTNSMTGAQALIAAKAYELAYEYTVVVLKAKGEEIGA